MQINNWEKNLLIAVVIFSVAFRIVLWLITAYWDCIGYGFSKAFCWAVIF